MLNLDTRRRAAVDLLLTRKQLAALESHQIGQRVLLQGKVDALRAMVTGQAADGINLLAPRQTVAEMAKMWADMKAADPAERQMSAAYMRMILAYSQKVNASQGGQPMPEAASLESALWTAWVETEKPEFQIAQAAAWIDSKRAGQVQAVADEMQSQADRVQAARAAHKARIDELRALGQINDRPEVKAAKDAYTSATREDRAKAYETYFLLFTKARDEAKAQIDAGKIEADRDLAAALDALGATAEKVKTELLAASPISAEQGKAWADAQEIDSAAKSAMKKIGYPVDKVREDVAEFYRLTGGRLAKVRIKAGGGRASASGIHGHKNRTIKMGAGFNKETLFHELGHHLEADPKVYAAARGFLLRRRESPTVYSLRSLTGNQGYGRQEGAYRDKWFHPYVGKVYRYNVTEVFSMGLESFCSPGLLAERMAADPEHFKLIAGFLDAPPGKLFETVKEILAQAADAEEEAEEQAGTARDETLKKLAAGAALKKLDPEPDRPWRLEPGSIYEGSIVGSGIRVDVYAGKFRDYAGTKRMRKGWGVFRWKDPDSAVNRSLTQRSYFDRTEAIAAARIVAQTGEYPSGALRELQQTAEALQA